MPRAPKTVESFGPEIFEALLEGSKREVVVPLSYAKAVGFRQRANALRAAMRSVKHEKSSAVAGTTLRIVWGTEAGFAEVPEKRSSQGVRSPVSKNTPAKLIICPADAEFSEALRKAGVTIKPLGSDPDTPHTEATVAPIGDDILEKFLRGEDVK